jgi:hypothetical protein
MKYQIVEIPRRDPQIGDLIQLQWTNSILDQKYIGIIGMVIHTTNYSVEISFPSLRATGRWKLSHFDDGSLGWDIL